MLTKRNRAAIYQAATKNGYLDQVDRVYHQLEMILPLLGLQSQSNTMIYRIGLQLLKQPVRIVAPSCPDYAHQKGKYTFTNLGDGVPLLSQLHLELFDRLIPHLSQAQFEIVLADQEADDVALCLRTGKTHKEFLSLVRDSAMSIKSHIGNRPYQTYLMTDRFPTLRRLESEFGSTIGKNAQTMSRIQIDTIARSEMYRQLGVTSRDEMLSRTIRTAAQYCALASLAVTENFLVCNHDTVNLGWYNHQQAAVLHNNVSIY